MIDDSDENESETDEEVVEFRCLLGHNEVLEEIDGFGLVNLDRECRSVSIDKTEQAEQA